MAVDLHGIDDDCLLGGLCSLWVAKIRRAVEHKRTLFQDDADEAFRFFNGPHDWLYARAGQRGSGADPDDPIPAPAFRMTVNKVAEFVEIFGPVLYYKNPIRQITPRRPPPAPPQFFNNDPVVAQAVAAQQQMTTLLDSLKGSLLSEYLNFTPGALDLKSHAEDAIDEALIKGRGCLWTRLYQPPGVPFRMVGSFFDTVDALVCDPDAERFEDCWWIARRRACAVWDVEREFGLPRGTLKGNVESHAEQAAVDATPGREYDRKRGVTNDLIVFWEIYSRMGVGGRLSGSAEDRKRGYEGVDDDLPGIGRSFDRYGDNVYLVVAGGVDYPLNLPPGVQNLPGADGSDPAVDREIRRRLSWPIPFHLDHARWPVSVLDFHKVPRQPWPMSHLKPGLGELKFLDWAYSFLAGKIRNTCRDFVAVLKEAGGELKTAILEGRDLTLLEIDPTHKTIAEVIQFLQHPQMNADIFKVLEAIERNFERRVGLNELIYGESEKQLRSASEADMKSRNMNIRPDDMVEKTEAWMTEVARKEAVAARLLLAPADVQPVLGVTAANLWGRFVSTSDAGTAFLDLDYRIEAGSTRKPNRDRDVQNADNAAQVVLPFLENYTMATQNVGPVNNFLAFWAKTRDLDPGLLQLPPPPPMPMPPPGPGGPPRPGAGPPPRPRP